MAATNTAAPRVDISELFNTRPFTSYQLGICFLCLCVSVLDGFDNQVMGFAAPSIAQALHLSPKALGSAFSAGQIGALIGALGLGTLADRLGRKRMLILCACIFGFFTLLITRVNTVEQLALCRLLGGIGLGGTIPNALAFGAEYAPRRLRASLTTLMWLGLPIGSASSGFAAAYMLTKYSWHAMFLLGGLLPLVIALLVALLLPESLAFLVKQGKDEAQIRRVVAKISPALAQNKNMELYSTEKRLPGVPVKHLFSEGRALTTFLIWMLFFLSFFMLIFLSSWTPTLLKQSGATLRQASIAFSFFHIGSMIATVGIGRIMDKSNPYRILTLTFVASGIMVAVFGVLAHLPFGIVTVLAIVTGFFVCGANSGIMALAAISYPVAIRGTGIGWAYAMGRFGAMSGPMLGGLLLARHWSVGLICTTVGIAGFLTAGVVVVLKDHTTGLVRRIETVQVARAMQ